MALIFTEIFYPDGREVYTCREVPDDQMEHLKAHSRGRIIYEDEYPLDFVDEDGTRIRTEIQLNNE